MRLALHLAAALLLTTTGAQAQAVIYSGGQPFLVTGSGPVVPLLPKLSAAPSVAPGAGFAAYFLVPGTNAGTCKLQVMAGTSTTPVTIVDNIGGTC